MSVLVTSQGLYQLYQYETEKEFEECVVNLIENIIGKKCIYLDCKRKIGKPGSKRSIPDAYLLDFNSRLAPKLFIVETEIAAHDLFQHIGVQLLQFAHSFTSSPRLVKQVLFEEISKDRQVYESCECYAQEYGLRNLDNMLDQLVNGTFQVLVIIDEATTELYKVVKNFRFPVEVIEVVTYRREGEDSIYRFTPLLEDVTSIKESIEEREHKVIDVSEFDTIIVPAREDGFQEVFIGENRWYAIRMHVSMIPQIKYIAAYRIAPISAITHWALVKDIELWGDSGKFCVNFVGMANEMEPIPLVPKSRIRALQGPRYTSFDRLQKAKNLNEVF